MAKQFNIKGASDTELLRKFNEIQKQLELAAGGAVDLDQTEKTKLANLANRIQRESRDRSRSAARAGGTGEPVTPGQARARRREANIQRKIAAAETADDVIDSLPPGELTRLEEEQFIDSLQGRSDDNLRGSAKGLKQKYNRALKNGDREMIESLQRRGRAVEDEIRARGKTVKSTIIPQGDIPDIQPTKKTQRKKAARNRGVKKKPVVPDTPPNEDKPFKPSKKVTKKKTRPLVKGAEAVAVQRRTTKKKAAGKNPFSNKTTDTGVASAAEREAAKAAADAKPAKTQKPGRRNARIVGNASNLSNTPTTPAPKVPAATAPAATAAAAIDRKPLTLRNLKNRSFASVMGGVQQGILDGRISPDDPMLADIQQIIDDDAARVTAQREAAKRFGAVPPVSDDLSPDAQRRIRERVRQSVQSNATSRAQLAKQTRIRNSGAIVPIGRKRVANTAPRGPLRTSGGGIPQPGRIQGALPPGPPSPPRGTGTGGFGTPRPIGGAPRAAAGAGKLLTFGRVAGALGAAFGVFEAARLVHDATRGRFNERRENDFIEIEEGRQLGNIGSQLDEEVRFSDTLTRVEQIRHGVNKARTDQFALGEGVLNDLVSDNASSLIQIASVSEPTASEVSARLASLIEL